MSARAPLRAKPVISGNTISDCQTGMNLGTRAFGSSYRAKHWDYQQQIPLAIICLWAAKEAFKTRALPKCLQRQWPQRPRFDLVGNTGADRARRIATITCNTMTGNALRRIQEITAVEGYHVSSTQAAGDYRYKIMRTTTISLGIFAGPGTTRRKRD